MHNLLVKSFEKILRVKSEASLTFEKSFFEEMTWVRKVIYLKSTKSARSCREIIATCLVIA
eukprot:UN22664